MDPPILLEGLHALMNLVALARRRPRLAIGSEYRTARQVEAIAAQAGGPVETLWLPGCGHSPHRDQPERVLAAIARFLAAHGDPRR